MTLSALSTPCVVIDRATALRNIARMQAAASARVSFRVRPQPNAGLGEVLDHPNLLVERLSEEQATVKVTDGVSNLLDHAWLIDEATALAITARGRIT